MGRLVQRNVRVIFTKATMIRSVLTLTELRDNFEDEKGRTGVPSPVFGEWPGKPRCQRKRSMIMPVHARLHPAQDCFILTPIILRCLQSSSISSSQFGLAFACDGGACHRFVMQRAARP